MAPLRFHHVGLAVHNIESACAELRHLGYGARSQRYVDARQGIDILLLDGPAPGWPSLELIQPHREDSAVSGLLAKHGAMPYHLCFEVGAVREAVEAHLGRGYTLVGKPFESPAFGGRLACFLYHRHVGLIELVERADSGAAG